MAGLEEKFRQAIRPAEAAAIRADYETFCDARRAQIEDAFLIWLTETNESLRELDAAGRINPSEQLFSPTEHDRVRRMRYPDDVTDAVFVWIDTSLIRLQSGSKPDLPTFKVRPKKRDRLVVRFFPDRIELEPRDEGSKKLVEACPGTAVTSENGKSSVPTRWSVPPSVESVVTIGALLKELAPAVVQPG